MPPFTIALTCASSFTLQVPSPDGLTDAAYVEYCGPQLLEFYRTATTHHVRERQRGTKRHERQLRGSAALAEITVMAANVDRQESAPPGPTITAVTMLVRILTGSAKLNDFLAAFCLSAGSRFAACVEWTWATIVSKGGWLKGYFDLSKMVSFHKDNIDINTSNHVLQTGGIHDTLIGYIGRLSLASGPFGPKLPQYWPLETAAPKAPAGMSAAWGIKQSPAPLGPLYKDVQPHASFGATKYLDAITETAAETVMYDAAMEHPDIRYQNVMVAMTQGYENRDGVPEGGHCWATDAPVGGKATDANVVYRALLRLSDTLEEFGQRCALLGMDGGDCIASVRLVWADPAFNARFLAFPGGLHVGMIMLKLLGKAGGSHNGIGQIWIDSGVASARTVVRVNEGKDYIRGRRLWTCTARSITKLIRTTYHSEVPQGASKWDAVMDELGHYVNDNRPDLAKGIAVKVPSLADMSEAVAIVSCKSPDKSGRWTVKYSTVVDDADVAAAAADADADDDDNTAPLREDKTFKVLAKDIVVISPPSTFHLRSQLPPALVGALDEHEAGFKAWVAGREKDCAMLEYWNGILEINHLFTQLVLNVRCTKGDFATVQVRAALLDKMAAYSHAFDCTLYARILSAFIAQLKRVHVTHPDVWQQLHVDGDYGFQPEGMSRIDLDHALEAWGIRESKRSLKTIAKNVASEDTFRAMMLSSAVKSSYVRSAMVYAGREEVVLRQYTKRAEVGMAQAIYGRLLTCANPFSLASTKANGAHLWNIANHALAPPSAVPRILGAYQLGVEQREAFQPALWNGEMFWGRMARNNIPKFNPITALRRNTAKGGINLASSAGVLYEIMTRALSDPGQTWTAAMLLQWSLVELPRIKADECGNALLEESKVDLITGLKQQHARFSDTVAKVVQADSDVPVAFAVDLGQAFVRQAHDPDRKLTTYGDYIDRIISTSFSRALAKTVNVGGSMTVYLCGELYPDGMPSTGTGAGGVVPAAATPLVAAGGECSCAAKSKSVLACDGPCRKSFKMCCLELSEVPKGYLWHCSECSSLLRDRKDFVGFTPRNTKILAHTKRVGSSKMPVSYSSVVSNLAIGGQKILDVLRSTHNKVLLNKLLIERLKEDPTGRVCEFLRKSGGGCVYVMVLEEAFSLRLESENGELIIEDELALKNNLLEADHRLDSAAVHFATSVPDDSGWRAIHPSDVRSNATPTFASSMATATETSADRPAEMHRGIMFKLVEDTDCTVSAISLNHTMEHIAHGILYGTSTSFLACDTHAMADSLGSLAARALRALHVLSGNDEIAKTKCFGKRTWLKKLLSCCNEGGEASASITEGLLKLGTKDWTELHMHDLEFVEMVRHIKAFYLQMFGIAADNNQVKTLADCRIWQYTTSSGTKKDLADLCETDNQFAWHCLRANHSAHVYHCASCSPPQQVPPPAGRGWVVICREDGRLVLVPRWSSEPALPQALAAVFACKTCGHSRPKRKATGEGDAAAPSTSADAVVEGCKTTRCVCKKSGRPCTFLCGCLHCCNPNGKNDRRQSLGVVTGAAAMKQEEVDLLAPPPPPFLLQDENGHSSSTPSSFDPTANADNIESSSLEDELAEQAEGQGDAYDDEDDATQEHLDGQHV